MLISCVNILLNYIYSKVKKAVLRIFTACGLIEKANRRNKANTLTKMQKLKILDAATPRIFKITQKLKLISYFCCELYGFVCQTLFADIDKTSVW